MADIKELVEIVRRKHHYDRDNSWANGSSTYLNEITKEVDEVKEELKLNRNSFLEDELGDILWDYLNIVINLEEERGISLESVLKRSTKKYGERVTGIESGIAWGDIKKDQIKRLLSEEKG